MFTILQINNLSRTELVASVLIIIITNPGDTEEAIDDLTTRKCAGLDNIHAEHLKNASKVLNVLLSILCTTMMKHGYVVSKIVETVIIPYFMSSTNMLTSSIWR